MRRLIVLFIMCAASMGCALIPGAPASAQESASQRRVTLDQIATECGLPASVFVMAAADEVRIQIEPDMPYEKLVCALGKLRASNIPLNTMGFVGNEAIEVESTDASAAPDQRPVVGWTVYAPTRRVDEIFARFIVSGPADAVDEFTRESETEGWILEGRASTSASLLFAQYRVPTEPVRTTSFMDRYLRESPRRLNIAGVVSKADAQ